MEGVTVEGERCMACPNPASHWLTAGSSYFDDEHKLVAAATGRPPIALCDTHKALADALEIDFSWCAHCTTWRVLADKCAACGEALPQP